jgi:ornithine cyclodeaminase/alanine dehydrogenase-like protein (mu-crystallin family)
MGMLVLSDADVRRLLPMGECIEVMAEALAALERGDTSMPLRTVFRSASSRAILLAASTRTRGPSSSSTVRRGSCARP